MAVVGRRVGGAPRRITRRVLGRRGRRLVGGRPPGHGQVRCAGRREDRPVRHGHRHRAVARAQGRWDAIASSDSAMRTTLRSRLPAKVFKHDVSKGELETNRTIKHRDITAARRFFYISIVARSVPDRGHHRSISGDGHLPVSDPGMVIGSVDGHAPFDTRKRRKSSLWRGLPCSKYSPNIDAYASC